MKNRKPNFLIVGTMKGGTSSLAYMLSHHKDIFIPDGEIFYFSNDENYAKGDKWYASRIGSVPEHKALIGEKTATYHFIDVSAERIQEFDPNMKLIWILRHPVKRSYSQYWHVQKQGGDGRSFDQAVADEFDNKTENIWNEYIKRSDYNYQIENYLQYFDKDNFHFLLFEDLLSNPLDEINKVLDFLEVPHLSEEELVFEPRNVTYISAYPRTLNLFRRWFGKTIILKIIRRILRAKKAGYPKMNPDTKKKLETHFEKQYDKLEQLTGLDISSWRK